MQEVLGLPKGTSLRRRDPLAPTIFLRFLKKYIQYTGGFSLVEVLQRGGESENKLVRRYNKKIMRIGILSSARNKS